MTCRVVPSHRWKMKATNVYKLHTLYITTAIVLLKPLWRKVEGDIEEHKTDEQIRGCR